MVAAVSRFEKPAPRTAGTKCPSLPPEVPQGRINGLRFLLAPAEQSTTGGTIWAGQHFLPRLAAIGGFENTAFVVVVPEVSGCADQYSVAVFWVDRDFCDVLSVFQSNVGPVLAAVSRFVNSVANRDAIARPRLSRAHPNSFRVRWINRHRSDRLHTFAVEHRLIGGAAINRLPNSAAGRSDEDGNASVLFHGVQRRDTAAHGGRADVAGRQSRHGRGVEFVACLSQDRRCDAHSGEGHG